MGKTKIELSDLIKDSLNACRNGFGGLLIIGGSLEDADRLKNIFQQKSDNQYPLVYRTAKEHEECRQQRKFGEKLFYLIDLDKIQLTSDSDYVRTK